MNSNLSDGPETLNSSQNRRFFCRVWPWNLSYDFKQGKSEGFDSCDRPSNLAQIWSKSSIFSACVTLKFDGWPWKMIGHLFHTTTSFVHHFQIYQWIQTEVTVRKRWIRVKIGDFLSRVTLKFDGWHWKTKGHLFYVASSFVHHSIAISEFKPDLQSGNAQFGSNWTIFRAVRPWNLTDDLAKQ